MKVTIDIEEYDNGIVVRWKPEDPDYGEAHLVYPKDAQVEGVGNMILEDIKNIMDRNPTNKVRMKIEYEPITEE